MLKNSPTITLQRSCRTCTYNIQYVFKKYIIFAGLVLAHLLMKVSTYNETIVFNNQPYLNGATQILVPTLTDYTEY